MTLSHDVRYNFFLEGTRLLFSGYYEGKSLKLRATEQMVVVMITT